MSCTSEVVLEPSDTSVKVIMNALLKTSDTDHLILLSASTVNETEALPGATVSVSVNGGSPVQAVYLSDNDDDMYSKPKAAYYLYQGSFQPGDEVLFEAKTKYGDVSSRVTVPGKVNMDNVDTLRTVIRGSGYTEVNMQFKIRVNDQASSADYYRFTFNKYETFDRDGTGEKKTFWMPLRADGSSDPVLSDGTVKTGDFLSELLEMDNTYLIFSDELFNGTGRDMRLNVNMEGLIASFSFKEETPDYDDAYVMVNMEHMSFEEYYYLKAMTRLSNLGYDASLIFEPTTIPSNVEGGLGFVSISTVSDPAIFRIPDDIYLYEIRYREEHPEENPYN